MPLTFTHRREEEVPAPKTARRAKNEPKALAAYAVTAEARIPRDVTQRSIASFLAEYLELREGLYLWRRGFDANEVRRSVEQRWGPRAWDRVRRQARRIASLGG